MASTHGEWCTIESDPAVFTELIRDFGVTGMQVEELYMLDESLFEQLRPIHGLIFLFKWEQEGPKKSPPKLADSKNIYFAKQVIHNACATQAIVNILLNVEHNDLKLGETLVSFKEFSNGFDPLLRGQCLSNCEVIRNVHNSFARNELFETFGRKAEKEEDVFHFVGYLPINGRLIELDGLAEGPIDHGEIPAGRDWLHIATPIIENRMNTYSGREIRFTLLALITDRKMVYSKQLAELQAQYQSMPTDDISQQIAQLNGLMQDEVEKERLSKVENIRRKHNFLPLIIELFKVFAESGNLKLLYDEASKKGQERERRNKRLKTEAS
ncbi:hypothetical protein RvY_03560 [Ramazzottius varieornatus]|uniref:Ubiquitin carboxyl-terminal hydrolase n=1 Tax=Ramazzottius varieornatus TaxID=947166 RepID=A0A1D1URW1_RAMVA|nr:hypothetical protein RvY_03560 [Ramazzottius varieornatus]